MKTIRDYRLEMLDMISTYCYNEADAIIMLKEVVDKTKSKIQFLESIYTSSAKHTFSERFKDVAYAEKQECRQLTSACYDMLRELYGVEYNN